jgi:hypothetical protein
MSEDTRLDILWRLISAEYERLAASVARQMTDLHDRDPMREDTDSWRAFATEIQQGEGGAFLAYEDVVRRFCEGAVADASEIAVTALWFDADEGYPAWDERDPEPPLSSKQAADAEELYRRVCSLAADLELEDEEPDEVPNDDAT